MIFVNHFLNVETKPLEAMKTFALLISPFAPHFAEEVWERMGGSETITYESWPKFDAEKIREENVEIVLQVNSKIKDRITVPVGTSADALEQIAKENVLVKGSIDGEKRSER